MIIITSKVHGYRRCGVEHPAYPTQHPDDAFTEEQLNILRSTDGLQVELTDEPSATLEPTQFDNYTVAQLKEMAAEMGLDVPAKITKKELIELICKEPVIPGPETKEE